MQCSLLPAWWFLEITQLFAVVADIGLIFKVNAILSKADNNSL